MEKKIKKPTVKTPSKEPYLEPCPLCGGKSKLLRVEVVRTVFGKASKQFRIYCITCNLRTPNFLIKKRAVAMWNNRQRSL